MTSLPPPDPIPVWVRYPWSPDARAMITEKLGFYLDGVQAPAAGIEGRLAEVGAMLLIRWAEATDTSPRELWQRVCIDLDKAGA